MQRWISLAALLPALLTPQPVHAGEEAPGKDEARLLRFPAVHGKQVVFTYAGDLHTVPSSGGIARRLTSHEGFEMFARFSPDGKHLAFTGQYDGNTEIYVIPSEGGVPKRLTYTATLGRDDVSDRMGPNNICMGWTPDGKYVVFRSRMNSFNDFIGQLYKVPVTGGPPQELPLPRGGFCSFSPDGTKLAYNRVFREFRTWKRYRGGMADDVWVYDFATKKTANLTKTPAQEVFPMWVGERIYFLSDRGKEQRMNLYSCDSEGKDVKQHTAFKDFDIKFPSCDSERIVFEYAGWIYSFDTKSDKTHRIPVRILEDRVGARALVHAISRDEVTNYDIAPDGKRALFGARGEVFTVPAKDGPTRNLTNTPGVHERNSAWSPDGKNIAFVSDKSGEDEIWMTTPDGTGAPVQLTKGADTYKYEISWSPDSRKILWSDKKNRLLYVEVASKEVKLVTQSKVWEIRETAWSPDSRWVAWAQDEQEGLDSVYLYSLEQGKSVRLTHGRYSSGHPAFSADGKYLFFVSRRDFNPTPGQMEHNHVYRDMSRIYLAVLSKDTPSPFRPTSDEVEVAKGEKPKADKPPEKPREVVVKVDVEGLSERVLQLPVQPANYRNLQSVGSTLYYIRQGSKDARPAFQMYDLAAKKETALGSVSSFTVSAEGKKMMVSQDRKFGIIDLPKGPVSIGEPLNLSGMEMQLDRRAEWRQIYHECWRQMRDFFYDPGMHGVDWNAVRQRYEPLLEHVSHRADLTYVIGEMISELNVGHAYVGGGDMPKPRRLPLGLLGATFRKDPKNGFFQIVRVLPGSAWDPALRSPLRELGVNAKEGEYVLEIDGKPTSEMNNLSEALVNKADKQVSLRLGPQPQQAGSRVVTVVPISSEAELYYREWVEKNRKRVEDATDGKVGYVHVPDMLTRGLNEFSRQFYPQVHKKALIVDVRGNGGGNVSPQLIERLRREAAMITIARNSVPRVNPEEMIYGPMACLMNEFSASDGDIFPYRFRQHRLGKLIGKRSWGGVVGIRGSLPLLDGGYMNRPEFSRYDLGGKEWIMEGYGVDPDIVVDNDPAREYAGQDDQLERAIQEILAELKTKEKTIPPPPPYPKR